jgi:hypothetical protein
MSARKDDLRKPLFIMRERPDVEKIHAEIRRVNADAQRRCDELSAMAKHIVKQTKDSIGKLWDDIETAVRPELPSDYSRGKYGFEIDKGVFFLVRDDAEASCRCPVCLIFGKGAHL